MYCTDGGSNLIEAIRRVLNKSANDDQAVLGLFELLQYALGEMKKLIWNRSQMVLQLLSKLEKAQKDRNSLFGIARFDAFTFDNDPTKRGDQAGQILFLIDKINESYTEHLVQQLPVSGFQQLIKMNADSYYHFRSERKRLLNTEASEKKINEMLRNFEDPALQLDDNVTQIQLNDDNTNTNTNTTTGSILSGRQLSNYVSIII